MLAVLADRGVCGFGELATLTSIEPATLSRFVEALIRDRLIRRRRSSADGRAVTITLTEKGEAASSRLCPGRSMSRTGSPARSRPRTCERLKAMLKTMYANIHAEFGDPRMTMSACFR